METAFVNVETGFVNAVVNVRKPGKGAHRSGEGVKGFRDSLQANGVGQHKTRHIFQPTRKNIRKLGGIFHAKRNDIHKRLICKPL